MSSKLSIFDKFSSRIEVIINEQHQLWFKHAHGEKLLGIKHKSTLLEGLDKCGSGSRKVFQTTYYNTVG